MGLSVSLRRKKFDVEFVFLFIALVICKGSTSSKRSERSPLEEATLRQQYSVFNHALPYGQTRRKMFARNPQQESSFYSFDFASQQTLPNPWNDNDHLQRPSTLANVDQRPPYEYFTLGQSIKVSDENEIPDEHLIMKSVTTLEPYIITSFGNTNNWSIPLHENGERIPIEFEWEPFIGSGSHSDPFHFPSSFTHTTMDAQRNVGARFLTKPKKMTKNTIAKRTIPTIEDNQSYDQFLTNFQTSIKQPHMEHFKVQRLSLKDFHKSGGFSEHSTSDGNIAFDGHSNIIIQPKTGKPPPISVIYSTPSPNWFTLAESSSFVAHPSKKNADSGTRDADVGHWTSFTPPVSETVENLEHIHQRSRSPVHKRHAKRKVFNNIAEIIASQEDLDHSRWSQQKSSEYQDRHFDGIISQSKGPMIHHKKITGGKDFPYNEPIQVNYSSKKNEFNQETVKRYSDFDFSNLYERTDLTDTELSQRIPMFHSHGTDLPLRYLPSVNAVEEPQKSNLKSRTTVVGFEISPSAIKVTTPTPVYGFPRTPYSAVASNDDDDDESPYAKSTLYNEEVVPYSKVSGEYRVALPDGRIQIVSYTADEKGYHPVVTYAQPDVPSVPSKESSPDIPGSISHSQFNTYT